jgi:hypothetical protein
VPQILDDKTKAALSTYLTNVRSLPNESAKTHRFAALIGELFPASKASATFAEGVEKVIRLDTAASKKKHGFIDSYYGNAVIEFENSLKATGNDAERQLREYVAGVWAGEGKSPRPLVAIASDSITWRTYRPTLTGKGTPKAENVSLERIREFTLSEATLGDFWLWLTSLLFRPEQILPTAEQFRQDFGATSPAFWDGLEALSKAWAAVRASSEPRLAFETWQKYLTVTYGSLTAVPTENEEERDNGTGPAKPVATSDLEILFLKHTYLASAARLLIWASFSRGKTTVELRAVASDVLSGRFFEENRLANFVEDDFFQWVRRPKAETMLAPIWERILTQMLTYDLSHLGEDVLKGVYQELVDPTDRHDLGEYYTPDWLCERIVTELLPAKGLASALDPTCGSGSFLRAVIAHLLKANPSGSDADRLQAILEHVAGIDIHPLAVTISRATYVLALGPLVKAAKRPIHIPVYLADSLFLPTEVEQGDLIDGGGYGYRVTFGGRHVVVPESLVNAPDLFDPAVAGCTRLAIEHAESNSGDQKSLRAYLAKAVPRIVDHAEHEAMIASLWKFTYELAELIRAKKNSIWGFIVRNTYRPAMLRGRFDYIVGNPPWLSYRFIADPEYQGEVKYRAIEQYKIAPTSQKLITQMELATVFLAHALAVFGKENSRLGFVMPRSVLSADQHVNLRTRSHAAPFRLTAYWDLREVTPLFNVPACVLFAQQSKSRGSMSDALPVKEWQGRLPRRDVAWAVAAGHLTDMDRTGRVIFLGARTALSTAPGRTKPNTPSVYAAEFRQGSTIVPRNFYFVRVKGLTGKPDPDATYWAETDPEQAEDAKAPYKGVVMKGEVEGRFLYSTALSRHLLPFVVLPPASVALPVERAATKPQVRTADQLKKDGWVEMARWMRKAETLWKQHRKAKAAKQSIYERLDYQKGLTVQDLSAGHLVVFNRNGTNAVAAHLARKHVTLPFIVDFALYWIAVEGQDESDYLGAVLNSTVVNDAIKPFQSVGLMGERDVTKKVLDLPVPRYSASDANHRSLAQLGAQARQAAAKLVPMKDFPKHLPQQRAFVRERLKQELGDIDRIVKKLL